MSRIRFFLFQSWLFSMIIVVSTVSDAYISHPFSSADFIALVMTIPLFFLIANKIGKMFTHCGFRTRAKVLLSVSAFIISFLCIGLLYNLWDEVVWRFN
ncbi:hypothetical protein V1502_19060 [Bacillus sp. SCS-153A]|uniref:hypothetical protein n=1 Tax=Rossellomorea sedimentorum TaxID=3115294 RepID=UPI003905ADE6